jgi:hypothetical protein
MVALVDLDRIMIRILPSRITKYTNEGMASLGGRPGA